MREFTVLFAVAIVLSATTAFAWTSTVGQEVTADINGDFLWNTSGNWSNGLPALDNRAYVGAGTTIVLQGTADCLFGGNAAGGLDGTVVVDAGATLKVGPTGGSNYQDVYINGGTLAIAGTMDISSSARDRQIYLNGGTLAVDGGIMQETAAGRWGIFTDMAAPGTVDLSGNYFITIGDEVELTNGTVKYSGDIADLGTFQVHKLTAGASTTFDLSGLTGMVQNDTVTLITNGSIASMALFAYDGSIAAQSWTVGDWQFNFVGGLGQASSPVDSRTLKATYLVPEPATMSLLVVGGLTMLLRRKRK